tara:strand:+ start:3071 stop:3922 length:852 start_codon:yes stop_codon:yes gene_type:complete
MRLKTLITNLNNPIFLVDASGVLYSHSGFLPAAANTFTFIQSKGPTFLVTNNSYHYVNDIICNIKKTANINLNPQNVISSGHGLAQDSHIASILHNKIVYFIGPDSAKHYVLDAPIKGLTNTLNNATAIVLAGIHESDFKTILDKITPIAKENKSLPIICCNKDHYIRVANGLQPVVGHFASQLENMIGRPLIWFGKPLDNFSLLVKKKLNKHTLNPTKNTLFFDDNLENVVSMQTYLGISGCWIYKTGIFYKENVANLLKKYGKPTYALSSFNLDETFLVLE